jgi:hypothetical protein
MLRAEIALFWYLRTRHYCLLCNNRKCYSSPTTVNVILVLITSALAVLRLFAKTLGFQHTQILYLLCNKEKP